MDKFFEENRREIIELEKMLTSHIAIAPEGGNALEAWLKSKGFTDIQRYEAPDSRVSSGSRPSLVVTIPGKDDSSRIWVMAHLDVVPTGDLKLWDSDPWTVVEKDGKLYIVQCGTHYQQ